MVTETQQVQSQFVNRVVSLPVVEGAIGVATNSYNKIKEMSPRPIKAVMEVGERTTNLALQTSQPILKKFQGPIEYVDQLACSGLDKVEEKVPHVKESPEKIINDVKTYGMQTATSVKEYGTQKMVQYGLGMVTPDRIGEYREHLVSYAAVALAAAEGALDSHLASRGAEVPHMDGDDLRARVGHVTAKARLCVTHHTTAPFVAAQKYASDGMGRVIEALQVIRALKTSVQDGKSVQEIAQELKFEWLAKLLEEAKDQLPAQQALYVAQAAAKEAQEALSRASGEIKSKVTDTYTRVTTMASELSSTLSNTTAGNLTTTLVNRLYDQAVHLQSLIQQLTGLNLNQYLPELRAVQNGHQNGTKSD